MSKKIVAVNAGPRKGWNTDTLINETIKNAKSAGITVGMCGEAAADERLIPRLVEWGLDVFSVAPSSILKTKRNICKCE